MRCKQVSLQVVLIASFLPAIFAKQELAASKRVPKQINTASATVLNSNSDHKASETGFGVSGVGGLGGHGKYFQYAHQPDHGHYEFGYRRGNEHHFKERYEKGHPHDGHFKTKVRWGDKHGGYGEHYWDYNHAGHGHEGGGDGGGGDGGGYGGYSEPIPSYQAATGSKITSKREYSSMVASATSKDERVKRHPEPSSSKSKTPKLVLDMNSGKVYDEANGKIYILQPIN